MGRPRAAAPQTDAHLLKVNTRLDTGSALERD